MKHHVPYLVQKPGKGGVPRYIWQPAKALRDAGWRPQRVPDNWAGLAGEALRAAAIAKAERLNAEVDAWRRGIRAPDAPAARPLAERTAPGSLRAVVAAYRQTRLYTHCAASTRRSYDQNLDVLERWAGDEPVRGLTAAMVEDLYMALQPKTPWRANAVVGMLRIVLAYALRQGLVGANAAAAPHLIGQPPSGRVWPAAAVLAFVDQADAKGWTAIGTAVMLNDWLGQREGDVLRMRPPAIAGGALVLRQGKTGAGVRLPIATVPRLQARLEAELARRAAHPVAALLPEDRPFLLDELTGARYAVDTFRHRFAAIRADLAVKVPAFPVDYIVAGSSDAAEPTLPTSDLLFRHLRHTAVVRLAEAGCEDALIAAITGHSLAGIRQILERYLVRTGEMARVAFAKRLAKERGDG